VTSRHINEAAILAISLLDDEDEGWIGVDLDGTLAKHTGWKGITHIGDPIPAMVARVRRWVGRGKKVKIFTARADDEKGVNAIKAWLKKHELPDLEVTNLKDQKMIEFWDDKAVQVRKNTGQRVGEAIIGKDIPPPHMNLDDDAELEIAARAGFTAWEYALRRGKPYPRLLQAVTGTPFEALYRRHFKITQRDPFYT
jgi:hypothetical protein